jgi:serine/threonine protein kinase
MDTKVNGYVIKEFLMECLFGNVHKAVAEATNKVYAIKIISKENNSVDSFRYANEDYVAGMQIGSHPNLIATIDAFQTKKNIYIVTEYCSSGSLDQYIAENSLSEEEAIHILRGIINGYKFLHKSAIFLSSMSASHILLDKQGDGCLNAKLCEHGLSIKANEGAVISDINIVNKSSIIIYTPPEVLHGKALNYHGNIFEIGVIFYEMLFSCVPFKVKTISDLKAKYDDGTISFDRSKISLTSAHFILGCLQYDALKRFNEEKLESHDINAIPYSQMKKFKNPGEMAYSIYKQYKISGTADDLEEVLL